MLTAEELCDICGPTPAQRQAWAKEGDLRQQRGFEELDAVELAVYARLRAAAGPKRAKAAWRELRKPLQEVLFKSPGRLWVVIEHKGVERHALVTRPAELSKQIEHGRPVVVIELRCLVELARASYRETVSRKRQTGAAEVRTLRLRS